MTPAEGGVPLRIKGYTLGPYQTNCYLLWIDGGTDAWVVDASFGPERIIKDVRDMGLAVSRLILTHAHVDHIAGVEEVLTGAKHTDGRQRPLLMIHTDEAAWLTDPMLNLSALGGMPVTTRAADALLRERDVLTLGSGGDSVDFSVLHTPGHSPGSVSLHALSHGVVLSGDALFAGSIGRTDFPGGDLATLERSIRQKLYRLPPQTAVLSGHGPATTIGAEMSGNPYVPAES